MLRRLTRLLIAVLCTVLLVSLTAPTAEARRKKKGMRVASVSRVGQDWYNSKLRVGWRPVARSSYYMRYADAPSKLSAARAAWTGTAAGTYTGTLDRGKTWYFQVRAVRGAKAGPWSPVRALAFANYYWPRVPTLSGVSRPGAVQFKWPYTPYASRYRVRWSAAWFGGWPGSATYVDKTYGGWMNQYVRQSTLQVPTVPAQGDNFLAVPYANPVFGQVEANNGYRSGASMRSKWVTVFPTPPAPAAGDPVRMGSYNVKLFPTGARATAIARNISSHGVTVAALQESNSTSASAVRSVLGSAWSIAPSATQAGQQILYRDDKFRVLQSGTFNVPNPRIPSDPIATPWTRLAHVNPVQGRSQNFYVVSVHFTEDSSKTRVEQNRDTGLAAKAAMQAIEGINYQDEPVIVAGDLRYGREPYGDPVGYTPAQPTFVRGGYYDAMASVSKVNHTYDTYNSEKHQVSSPMGLGLRADYILTKGIRGSRSYVNVANWTYNGSIPSDHNLIYADLLIPYL